MREVKQLDVVNQPVLIIDAQDRGVHKFFVPDEDSEPNDFGQVEGEIFNFYEDPSRKHAHFKGMRARIGSLAVGKESTYISIENNWHFVTDNVDRILIEFDK